MSYDLNFWRCKPGTTLDHQRVYERLCDGQLVDGLEELPIAEIVGRIREVFSDWNRIDDVTFEAPNGGVFQVYTTLLLFRVDCYGIDQENMNKIISVANEFGCPLYDPQAGIRFDGI